MATEEAGGHSDWPEPGPPAARNDDGAHTVVTTAAASGGSFDGSESLWCYTRPQELYGELRDALGHFPLMHFWGPLANIKSTDWIVNSASASPAP